ncbi:MAG: HAD-IC family P-type ATPase, partial [Ruminococcus flavefaciens]|nr:HAD-IC family P-type ATPase [Ruminococcus flavefaciens]
VIGGKSVYVGNARLMERQQVAYVPSKGIGTAVYVASGRDFLGSVLISDEIKPTAREAMDGLKACGVRRLAMLTGDREETARSVASDLHLTEYHAELLPADKVERVETLLGETQGMLAFVGDGVNDAPVLARADVGIAMGALGSDAAIEAADVVLMDDDPRGIAKAIQISRRTKVIVWENIWFAIGIKFLFLCLIAFGLTNMWAASFADVGVAVIAILNATRAGKH